jgi:hypothetical protein
MLNRLDVLRELDIDPSILEGVPPHRVVKRTADLTPWAN